MALNDTLNQMDLTDIFRPLYPRRAEYTFISSVHWKFFRIDHILGDKTSLNKFKKTKVTSCIFSDHNPMKLETNHKKKKPMSANTWKLNNMLLNNNGSNMKSKKKLKIHVDKWKWKHNNPKSLGRCKSGSKGEFCSNMDPHQKQDKSQINNQTLHLKELEK